MADLEGIVRPFLNPGVAPTPFVKPGTVGTQPVHVIVGSRGGTKTFSWSGNTSNSLKMGAAHRERAPASEALQGILSRAGK